MSDEKNVTVKAVVAYAAQVRREGDRRAAADVYANPYRPTEKSARNLSFRLGPEKAIEYIRARAMVDAREARENAVTTQRVMERHSRRQTEARAAREKKLAQYKPGHRIDLAIAQLSLVASPAASNPSPSSPDSDPDYTPKACDDLVRQAREDALVCARAIESLVTDLTVRNMAKAA